MIEKLRLFKELCALDMKQRTAGTTWGIIWIYLTPAVSMLVIWFVFQFGIRSMVGSSGIYSLLVGLIAWQLISDTLTVGTGAFIEKPYLIKKIRFPVAFLPLIKVVNSFWIHFPFLLAAIAISVFHDTFSFYRLFLYLLTLPVLFVFLTSIVFFLSTVAVFYRDIQSLLGVAIQLMFWSTPIIWGVPENYPLIRAVQNCNPFFMIVEFYRYCFLGELRVSWSLGAGFFVLFLGVFFISRKVFMSLKSQFSDVL